jgi:hypothetical protein
VPLDYERGPDKVWIYGALCVRDGQTVTQTAAAGTTTYRAFLKTLDHAYPQGDLYLVADNLSSHSSGTIRDWLADHPRIQHAFIPVGAAWLNLIEGWWRIFRRGQPPFSSIVTPGPESGAAHCHPTGACADASPIAFEERRTSIR